MYDQVVQCQRAGLCLSEHFLIKIVAARCQILRLKCTKFDFRWGSAPDPAGGAPPDHLAGFKGPYF